MRLSSTMFLSLDNVVQGPGGPTEDTSDGFDRGGWLVPFADEVMGEQMVEWFALAGAFLLGRRTYQIFASYWPRVTDPGDPIATALNTLPKHVVTTTLSTVDWLNSSIISGDVVKRIQTLKEQPGAELQVHGSPTLVRFLMAERLLDELRLITFPVVVGAGQRLFPESGPAEAFTLIDTAATTTGAVIRVYQPAGPATFGSFALEEGGAPH
jgi:dihydrofolate reductase